MQRYEIKFDITQENINKIIKDMNLTKIYPNRIVNSTYFDTNNFKFFSLSEEGVTPRIKVRTRCYNDKNLMNLEIKKTNNYHREKIIIKNFNFSFINFYKQLKKNGISETLSKKLVIRYKREYYKHYNIGRVTIDTDIQFSFPQSEDNTLVRVDKKVMEIKIQKDYLDKSKIEKIVQLRECRFSKYCLGINKLYR